MIYVAYSDYGRFYGECDPNPNPYPNPYCNPNPNPNTSAVVNSSLFKYKTA